MPFFVLAGASILGSVAGATISGNAADSAAQTEANAANQASALQQKQFAQTQANEQPYISAGQNALTSIMSGLGLQSGGNGHGVLNTPFSNAQYTASPGYQWQLQQGIGAAENAATLGGSPMSGNTLRALTQYGQGMAATDYQTALTNYMAQQNQSFNQLQTVAGSGQNAGANLGALGSQTASNIGNNITGAANASAAAQVAGANATTGAISSGVNSLSNAALMQQIYGGGGGIYGGGIISPNSGAVDTGAYNASVSPAYINTAGFTPASVPMVY